jgi:uncharacterized membrane protein YfcA
LAAVVLVSIAGFIAQLIDGSMGMAFGIVSTSVLILLAYNPAVASAIVHLSEIVTSFMSGLAHIRAGNVDWHALWKVAIPGAIGAFFGAIFLSNIDFAAARPWTATVLTVLGLLILFRFTRAVIFGRKRVARAKWLSPLGLVGGFIDSTGGGGWGPVVTTSLTASNALSPKKAIGTTNTAEFIIALAASGGFLFGIGPNSIPWDAVFALMIGGAIAAPVAAWLVSKAPQRILGILVGNVVVMLNVRQLVVHFEVGEIASGATFVSLGILLICTVTVGVKFRGIDRE